MGAFLTRRRRVVFIAVAVVTVAAAVIAIAALGGGGSNERDTETTPTTASDAVPEAPPSAGELEKLADGVILAGFNGDSANEDVVPLVTEHDLGGVLVRSPNAIAAGQTRGLAAAIGKAGSTDDRLPPLIAVAQEGGPYRALPFLPPDQREVEIGTAGDVEAAEKWMGDTAKKLRDVGITLNLAPIADVATLDSPIADRAFSDDATVAAEMTEVSVKACTDAGIACAPAHFPGLGAANASTDVGPASVGLDATTLNGRDLIPFIAAFEAGAPATVVSSAFYTAYDPVSPASLTPAIATKLLREDAGFDGVAISDDLSSGAINAVNTPGDAAVKALAAGIDLVQVADPGDVGDVRKAIEEAVNDGTLSVERLRIANERILDLKKRLAEVDGGGKD